MKLAKDNQRWRVLRGPVTQFALVTLLASVVLLIGGLVMSREVAERLAIASVRNLTEQAAARVIQPEITSEVYAGSPDAQDRLNTVIARFFSTEGPVRVKIWTPDGLVLYSDAPELVGNTFPVGDDLRKAFASGRSAAAVSSLDEDENIAERGIEGQLLEVYVPIAVSGKETVLFESYYSYDSSVGPVADQLLRSFVPILAGAILVLAGSQIPLAWSLARRLRRGQEERELLLRRALDASSDERRRVAAFLHDGAVQDLVGTALELDATSALTTNDVELSASLRAASNEIRRSIRSLRSLSVEIYPPNLRTTGLEAALVDLVASLGGRGVDVSIEIDESLDLGTERNEVVYRFVQEGVRNVIKHADARTVQITVRSDPLHVSVVDDGVGFDTSQRPDSGKGDHMGLRLLDDLASGAGTTLEVHSEPGIGTHVSIKESSR